MVLRYLARTLGRRDPHPPDSTALASDHQERQGTEAQVVEGTRTMDKEVDQLLAKLKSAGKEIADDETVRIIEDEIARIKAEAARGGATSSEATRRNQGIRWWRRLACIAASCAVGFYLGVDLFRRAAIKELTEGSHGELGFYLMCNALAQGRKGGVKKS